MMYQSGIFRSCASKADASITEVIALWAVMQAGADDSCSNMCFLEIDIMAATAGLRPPKVMGILNVLHEVGLVEIDGGRMVTLLPSHNVTQGNATQQNETVSPQDATGVE